MNTSPFPSPVSAPDAVSVTPLSVNVGEPFLKWTLLASAAPPVRATNRKPVTRTTPILGMTRVLRIGYLPIPRGMEEPRVEGRGCIITSRTSGSMTPFGPSNPTLAASSLDRPRLFGGRTMNVPFREAICFLGMHLKGCSSEPSDRDLGELLQTVTPLSQIRRARSP